MELIPVDHDPFAEQDDGPRAALRITVHPKGSGQRLVPVDHDPFAPPSEWGGRLKQAGVGLAKGAIGLVGFPGDVGSLMDLGFSKIDRMLGRDETKTQESLQSGRDRGPSNSHDIQGRVEQVTGKFREPQTTGEKYIDTASQFIPAALGPGGIVKNLTNATKYGVIPGLVSEKAGQMTEGTAFEPWARAGAGLLTGLGVAGASGLGSRPAAAERTIRGAIPDNIPPQAWDAAEKLFQEAHAAGQPITRAEAIQQVTKGGTGLGNVQRVIEGQGELRPMMADRAAGNEAAARPAFDAISPATREPSMVGPDIGEAATNTIRDLEKARTRAVDPFYEAANKERVPGPEIRAVVKEIDKAIKADKTGIVGGSLQEIRDLLTKQKRQAGTPSEVILHDASVPEPFATANPVKEVIPGTKRKNETLHADIESLDRVRKYVRDKLDLPQIGADAITKEQSAGILKQLDKLKQKMLDASPNFRQGKELYEDITKQFINPIMAGPLGKLAAKDVTTKKAIEALFPSNPLAGSAEEISTAVSALAKRNPEAAKRLVRAHAEMTFNEATQNLIKGANEFGGAKFAAGIRGNPQQAANLEAAITALPNGDQIYKGFDRFLNFVEAQGQRQAIGSQTAFNTELLSDLKRGTPLQEAGNAALTGGLKIPATLKGTLENWRLGRGTKDIAHLLTDPASVNRFRAIAQMPSGAVQASRVAIKLALTAAQGARGGSE